MPTVVEELRFFHPGDTYENISRAILSNHLSRLLLKAHMLSTARNRLHLHRAPLNIHQAVVGMGDVEDNLMLPANDKSPVSSPREAGRVCYWKRVGCNDVDLEFPSPAHS